MSALSDLRVVDLSTGVAGPFCSKMFADFGADVIKVEPPDGDDSRALGPFPDNRPDPESSGMFIYLNRNKRGVTLDIESDRGRTLAADLFADADVLVETFPPGYMASLGFAFESLEARNPSSYTSRSRPSDRPAPGETTCPLSLYSTRLRARATPTGRPNESR